jgi:polysaccharide biosynthesis transport protein
MSFGQCLAILKARWKAALLVFLLTVLTSIAVSLLLPKQYTATASVVVDFKPDPVTAMIYSGMAPPGLIGTQVEVLQSERVARRVIRNLKLADNPQVRDQWRQATAGVGSIETWLLDNFQKRLEVKPSREASVITVSYKAADPNFAAGVANAYVQAYLETSLALRVDPAKQYSAFFDSRAKEARETLEKAQAKVSAFQKAKGIIATDERLDIETARLSEVAGLDVRGKQPPSAGPQRLRRQDGRGAEQPVDRHLESRLVARRCTIARVEFALGNRPSTSAGGQGQHRVFALADRC